MKTYDVAIIGGGPAGLSAALVLARARRSVILFDAGAPRNAHSPGVQGFISRDGVLPAQLKTIARSELGNYGCVKVVASEVNRFESHKRHSYIIEGNSGRLIRARLIILAVGMVDILPNWSGFSQLWGQQVMHCAHCHGWEERDRHWGIVADNLQQIASVHQYRCWTDRVTVFADPELDIPKAVLSRLSKANIEIAQCRVRDLIRSADGQLKGVKTDTDEALPCEILVHAPRQRAADLVRAMRIKTNASDRVVVDGRNETNLSRVFAVGDITPGPQNALAAAAEGAAVAKNILPDIALATMIPDRKRLAA